MIRAAVLFGAWLGFAVPAAVAQEPETPAQPVLQIDIPEPETIPGQPLSLRLTILVPTFLPEPPVWPRFEAPDLLVRLPERSTGPTSARIGGKTWSGVTRHYRIAPLVPGDFTLPAQEITVTWSDPATGAPATAVLATEPVTLRSLVPEGAEGLDPFIAARGLELSQQIDGTRDAMTAGDSLTRQVTARVEGVSPMVLPPLVPPGAVEGLAAYADAPVLSETETRGAVGGSRSERVSYVAEHRGSGALPAIALDWFDIEAGVVSTARLDAVAVEIAGPPAARAALIDWRLVGLRVLAALAVVVLLALLVRRLGPVLQRRAARWRAARLGSEPHAWRALGRVVAARDHAALRPALDLWASRAPGDDPRAEAGVQAALLALGSARYGDAPGAEAEAWSALQGALAQARRKGRPSGKGAPGLPPLNPTGPALIALLAALPDAAPADPRGYLGSAACADCHEEATAAWAGSHHAGAWVAATPETVAADFDGTVFAHDGMRARFAIGPEGQYRISVTEKDGVTTEHQIHSVVGVAPLQQYLIETEPGRLQSFDVVWDTEAGGWFHLYPDADLPPDDGLHWTGPYKTWNARCAECHATGFEKNYDARARTYASRQVEMGVGCEACHGPGEAHVAWARATTRSAPPPNHGFAVDFSDRSAAIQQCATCHSRREAHLDGNPLPGTAYGDAYALALLRPGLYHADGQILDEVFVYGSFLQSKMYAAGVGCGDCHDGHSATRIAEGNAACTQCHSPAGNPDFPTLTPADYDSPSHHFHPDGSAGAQCKSCHMPEQVYMGNDWRADHSFRVPRPDLAPRIGAPDACTACHAGRDPAWAAAEIAARFPDSTARGPHYGLTLAHGRADPAGAAADLGALARDTDTPGIVRATALWLLEQSGDADAAAVVAPLLADPDPLVRAAAAGAQRLAGPQERVLAVVDLLDDPVLSVRIAAARALLDAPIARLPRAMAEDMRGAMGDWQASLGNRLDFPETHLQLAGIALTMRNMAAAEDAFAEAVRLDPQRQEAWVMRVRIAAATDGAGPAAAIARQAVEALPNDLVLQDMLAELEGRPPALLPPTRGGGE